MRHRCQHFAKPDGRQRTQNSRWQAGLPSEPCRVRSKLADHGSRRRCTLGRSNGSARPRPHLARPPRRLRSKLPRAPSTDRRQSVRPAGSARRPRLPAAVAPQDRRFASRSVHMPRPRRSASGAQAPRLRSGRATAAQNLPAGLLRGWPVRRRSRPPPRAEGADLKRSRGQRAMSSSARRRETMPKPRPQRSQVLVRRIFGPVDAAVVQQLPQRLRPKGQQRTQQADPAVSGTAGIAARPCVMLPPQHPHRHRLHLIRRMMAKQQMQRAGLPAGVRQALVAHDPRPFGQRWSGRRAGQRQQSRRNAQAVKPADGDSRFLGRVGRVVRDRRRAPARSLAAAGPAIRSEVPEPCCRRHRTPRQSGRGLARTDQAGPSPRRRHRPDDIHPRSPP